MEEAGALYGGYIARGGYQARGTRLDFDSFLDALPKEFWGGEKVEQIQIEETILSVQEGNDVSKTPTNLTSSVLPIGAKTILALEFLGDIEELFKSDSNHLWRVGITHSIINRAHTALINAYKGNEGSFTSFLTEQSEVLKKAEELKRKLNAIGLTKDKEQIAEVVNRLQNRVSRIEEGLKILQESMRCLQK